MSNVLDRAMLEESTLSDLHAIASELSIDGYRRLRKGDLIDTIIAHQGGEEPDRPELRPKSPLAEQSRRTRRAQAEAAADEQDAADGPEGKE